MIALSPSIVADTVARRVAEFNGGSIRIFAGARPATPGAAETGTLLGIATPGAVDGLGIPFHGFTGGFGLLVMDGVAFKALTNGTATWFRLVGPGDPGGASSAAPRIDGDIGTFDNPGDMAWKTTAIVSGSTYSIDTFNYFIHPIGPTP